MSDEDISKLTCRINIHSHIVMKTLFNFHAQHTHTNRHTHPYTHIHPQYIHIYHITSHPQSIHWSMRSTPINITPFSHRHIITSSHHHIIISAHHHLIISSHHHSLGRNEIGDMGAVFLSQMLKENKDLRDLSYVKCDLCVCVCVSCMSCGRANLSLRIFEDV